LKEILKFGRRGYFKKPECPKNKGGITYDGSVDSYMPLLRSSFVGF